MPTRICFHHESSLFLTVKIEQYEVFGMKCDVKEIQYTIPSCILGSTAALFLPSQFLPLASDSMKPDNIYDV